VLRDPEIDLVVIATRHHEHADQVVRSLEAGKHVFVEKPLALSWPELDRVSAVYRKRDTPPHLLVGFNRRFSPALTILSDLVSRRRAPIVVEYRLNAGYIPLDHWVHGTQGGGRNIGEACPCPMCSDSSPGPLPGRLRPRRSIPEICRTGGTTISARR
jgi:predicted dehydrogenase